MGQSYQSGITSVTGTISASITQSPNTILSKTITTTGAQTNTIHTVTAGKTCRIIGMHLSCSSNTATQSDSEIQVNGVGVLKTSTPGTATAPSVSNATFAGSYNDALIANATEVIRLVSTGAANAAAATIFYIEV